MITVKNLAAHALFIIACGYTATAAAEVSPIVADYGNVAPILSEQNLENVFRTEDSGPWYVSFNLTKEANVALGVLALPPVPPGSPGLQPGGPAFDLSFIRIVTFADGSPVADGTDTFTNPFPDPIEHLVATPLSAGKYALEVNGFGDNRVFYPDEPGDGPPPISDAPDFTVRLQVMPIPEPETYTMLLAGMGLISFMLRRRKMA